MIVTIIKAIFTKFLKVWLALFAVFRRALCCWRKRHNLNDPDSLPFRVDACETATIDISMEQQLQQSTDFQDWNQWDEQNQSPMSVNIVNEGRMKPKNDFQKIQQSSGDEQEQNFFEDMAPRIKKAKKVILSNHFKADNNVNGIKNRLSVDVKAAAVMDHGSDLASWDDANVGSWEDDMNSELCSDTDVVLREKRHVERQQRMAEQQRRKMEREKSKKSNFMATKVS